MSLFDPLLEQFIEEEKIEYRSEYTSLSAHISQLKSDVQEIEQAYIQRLQHGAELLKEHFQKEM